MRWAEVLRPPLRETSQTSARSQAAGHLKRPPPPGSEACDSSLDAEARNHASTPRVVLFEVGREVEAVLSQEATPLQHLDRGMDACAGASQPASQVRLTLGHAILPDGEDDRPLHQGEPDGQAFCSPGHADLALEEFNAFGRSGEVTGAPVDVHHGQS